ncbi:MAG: type IX secretion system membrane protein PorP/SprF [Bacteroidia bacterium]|nr:type IX secretion system membrane protein PorP/SprF [Bacteroidia bacterium]
MKKIHKIIAIVLLVAGASSLSAQQQNLYSNYLLNTYAYNSGVIGSQDYMQANLFYRNQWVGFEGSPKTYMLSLYGPVKKLKNASVGGMINSDQTGLMTSNTGYLTFAYSVKLNKKLKLALGLSGGLKQYRIKLYDARTYDQGDEYLTGTILTANTFDANAGLYLHGEKFFLGLSSMNMLNNRVNWQADKGRLTPHYYAMVGYKIKVKSDYEITPSVLLKYNAPAPVQLEYSLRVTYKNWIWLGASYRNNDAVAAMVGVKIMKKLNIAYANDFTVSKLRNYNSGSHEISISYNFIKKKSITAADEEEFKIIDNSVKQNLKNKKPVLGEEKKDDSQGAPPKKEEKKAPEVKKEESKSEESTPKTEENKPE